MLSSSEKVSNEIYWGKDFDKLISLIRKKKIDVGNIKFFMGYSGWEHKQLENEITENSWLVQNNFSLDDIFKCGKYFWKKILLNLGDKYKLWANSPENPNYN